jgi:glycosyltransferase involved in cell wall biosynthesis
LIYNTAFAGSSWDKTNFVNFLTYEAMSKNDRHHRVRMVPDPVPLPTLRSLSEGRHIVQLPADGRLFGFVGTMDFRKAIPELLRAFRAAKLAKNDRLVLAGKLAPEYADLVNREYSDLMKAERLIVIGVPSFLVQ